MADSDDEYIEGYIESASDYGADEGFSSDNEGRQRPSADGDAKSRKRSRRDRKGRKGAPSGPADGPKTAEGLKNAATGGYVWEDEIQRSWDVVKEDEGGSLARIVAGIVQAGKKKRLQKDTTPIQRGLIRHLILVLDLSSTMAEKDLRPTRYQLMLTYAIEFVAEYFEQNPISQFGVVGMRDGIALQISPLSGNPTDHVTAMQALRRKDASGDPSLQNALEMARAALYHVPNHGTKEVLVVFGALLSADPGDIHQTIGTLVGEQIRVRVIGLAAQVAICQELCARTNPGLDTTACYGVVLNEQHFKQLMLESSIPPASSSRRKDHTGAELIRMGFPSRIVEREPSFCACHSNAVKGSYVCPRCRVKVCSLPTECPSCGLTLVLSTHLSRSYHHLLPLLNWQEATWAKATAGNCYTCRTPFVERPKKDRHAPDAETSGRYQCPTCRQQFCIDCDLFMHEVLHNCPGCESRPHA
ncbi:Ssl1-like-domain-containing protein [Dipodascopsis tothii]|uniref:Ssl1-like-domain-containing protein n=1 Tax=Dipodascopsis tothii TaxID=44089 RepID=UPI0034CD4D34